MKAVAETLGVARSNLDYRLTGSAKRDGAITKRKTVRATGPERVAVDHGTGGGAAQLCA